MFLLKPQYEDTKYRETVFYSRIKKEAFDIAKLKNCLRLAKIKDPSIVELNDGYVYQYTTKESIFIMKKDGRIYANRDSKEARRQALFLLKILHKYDLVEDYVRKQQHKQRKVIKGWIE